MYIHWDRNYEIGNGLIDAEHRMLMMFFKKLDIAIKTHESRENLMRVIVELRKFAEFHFYSEEILMAEVGYPDLAQHEFIHSNLLRQLDLFVAKVTHGLELPEDLLYFVNNWIIEHIGREDKKISDYVLQSAKRRPIGEDFYRDYRASSS